MYYNKKLFNIGDLIQLKTSLKGQGKCFDKKLEILSLVLKNNN